jgi:pimeloyl-ACP methyl ester carboxylesterase
VPQVSISHTLRRLRTSFDPAGVSEPELPATWHGAGPVVLVGGFCTTDLTLEPLRRNLERLGYTVTTYTTGTGMGCGRRTVESLADVVRATADADGAPVRLLGYSRGGQFARVLAADPSIPVRSLVTLGTPFDVYGVSRPLRVQAVALAVAGTLGVPGLFTLSCFLGSCCTRFHADLRAVPDVPFTAIYSRDDRLVRWRACVDPAARTVEVPGSHLGLLVDRDPLRAVAEALQHQPVPA